MREYQFHDILQTELLVENQFTKSILLRINAMVDGSCHQNLTQGDGIIKNINKEPNKNRTKDLCVSAQMPVLNSLGNYMPRPSTHTFRMTSYLNWMHCTNHRVKSTKKKFQMFKRLVKFLCVGTEPLLKLLSDVIARLSRP